MSDYFFCLFAAVVLSVLVYCGKEAISRDKVSKEEATQRVYQQGFEDGYAAGQEVLNVRQRGE